MPTAGKILICGFISYRWNTVYGSGWAPNVNVQVTIDGVLRGVACYIPWNAYAGSAILNKYYVSCPVGMAPGEARLAAGAHSVQMQLSIAGDATISLGLNGSGEGDGYKAGEVYGYDLL